MQVESISGNVATLWIDDLEIEDAAGEYINVAARFEVAFLFTAGSAATFETPAEPDDAEILSVRCVSRSTRFDVRALAKHVSRVLEAELADAILEHQRRESQWH